MGPVEYFVLEFQGNQFHGEIVPALRDAVASGAIKVVDLVFARKDRDGKVTVLELNQLGNSAATWLSIATETSDLLSDEDIELLVGNLESNSSAALLVIEHLWATRLREAVLRANGRLVADGIIPGEVVQDVIQARGEAAA